MILCGTPGYFKIVTGENHENGRWGPEAKHDSKEPTVEQRKQKRKKG